MCSCGWEFVCLGFFAQIKLSERKRSVIKSLSLSIPCTFSVGWKPKQSSRRINVPKSIFYGWPEPFRPFKSLIWFYIIVLVTSKIPAVTPTVNLMGTQRFCK